MRPICSCKCGDTIGAAVPSTRIKKKNFVRRWHSDEAPAFLQAVTNGLYNRRIRLVRNNPYFRGGYVEGLLNIALNINSPVILEINEDLYEMMSLKPQ